MEREMASDAVKIEYYELVLFHKKLVDGDVTCVEQPISIRGFVSPLVERSTAPYLEHEIVIDNMLREVMEFWKRTR